jgi:hypothetical protein
MKHTKVLGAGMLAVLLTFCFILAGCGNGTYHLKWGATFVSYSQVQSVITTQGWTVADSGTNWALVTGGTATSVYDYCMNNVSWLDGGDVEGSFEDCINFSKDGISALPELKTVFNTKKGKVPLAGVFDGGSVAVLFYITKN